MKVARKAKAIKGKIEAVLNRKGFEFEPSNSLRGAERTDSPNGTGKLSSTENLTWANLPSSRENLPTGNARSFRVALTSLRKTKKKGGTNRERSRREAKKERSVRITPVVDATEINQATARIKDRMKMLGTTLTNLGASNGDKSLFAMKGHSKDVFVITSITERTCRVEHVNACDTPFNVSDTRNIVNDMREKYKRNKKWADLEMREAFRSNMFRDSSLDENQAMFMEEAIREMDEHEKVRAERAGRDVNVNSL